MSIQNPVKFQGLDCAKYKDEKLFRNSTDIIGVLIDKNNPENFVYYKQGIGKAIKHKISIAEILLALA